MLVSYNAKLHFPTKEIEQAMLECLTIEKKCYNYVSQLLETNGYRNKYLSRYDIHNKFYHQIRQEFPGLTSQMVIKVILAVVLNWKTCRASGKSFKIPQKHNMSMYLDKRLYSKLTASSINLTVPGFRKVTCSFDTYKKLQDMFNNHTVQNCNIFYREKQFYLVIQFNLPELDLANNEILGIDRGIRRLVTCSDGTAISDKQFNARRRQIRYLKRRLRKINTKSAKRHLKALYHKEAHLSSANTHKVANELMRKPQAILVLENLTNIKTNTARTNIITAGGTNILLKKRRHNNRFGQVALRELQTVLEHKAPLYGKQVVTVEPAYTSKNDCRGISQGNRLGTRYYTVDGLVFDADWNAAINIANRYHPISFALPIYGKLKLWAGHRQMAKCCIV